MLVSLRSKRRTKQTPPEILSSTATRILFPAADAASTLDASASTDCTPDGWCDKTASIARVIFALTLLICGWSSQTCAHEPQSEANESVQAGSTEATEAYLAAAKAQNERDFESAAKLWQEFIDTYSDDPLVLVTQHYLGVCRLQSEDLAGAEEAFTTSLQGKKDCECREDTYIDLGWVHFLQGAGGDAEQMVAATRVFEEYLSEFPAGDWRDQAHFYRGEALVHLGNLEEAMLDHQRVVDEFANSPLRAESLFALGTGRQELGDGTTATKYLDAFLKEFPNHEFTSDVAFRRGQLYVDDGNLIQAAEMFAVAGSDAEFVARDQARFQCGYCFSASEQYELAGQQYASVSVDCDDSPLAEQACLDAGRCFFHAGNYDKAVDWLDRASNSKDMEQVLQAQHWICRLDLAQQRYEAGGREAQRGLKWIEQNADATHIMRLPLMLDYAEALEGIPDQQASAQTTFLSLVKDYPKTEVAPRALYRAIRLAITLNQKEQTEVLVNQFSADYGDHDLAVEVTTISADFLLASGKPAAAESKLQKLLKTDSTPDTVPATESTKADEPTLAVETLGLEPTPAVETLGLEPTLAVETLELEPTLAVETLELEPTPAENAATMPPPRKIQQPELAEEPILMPFQEPTPVATTGPSPERNVVDSAASPPIQELPLKLGHSLFLQKKYQACVATLSPVVNAAAKNPEQSHAFYLMGTSQFHLQEFDAAVESLSAALLCDPNGKHAPQICVRLAQSLKKDGRTGDAKTVLARVVAVFKESDLREECLLQLAEFEYASDDHAAGLRWYKQLLKEYPQSKWANRAAFGVARIAVRQNEPDRAIKLMDHLLVKRLSSELKREVLRLRASILQKKGEHASCLKDLEQLITETETGDARSDALLMAAPSHIAVKHPGLARQCLESILQDNPTYPRKDQVLYQLAWIAKRGGDGAAATRQFGTLAATLPNSPLAAEANYHMGEEAFVHHRINEALPYFATAAKSSRNLDVMEKSIHRLAWCYFHQRKFSNAEAAVTMQLEKFPGGRTSEVAQFLLAEAAFLQSDYSTALERYRPLRDGEGLSARQEAMVYLHAGQSAGKQEQWKEAERWLAQIHLKFSKSEFAPTAYWELARILKAQERSDDATTALRRAAQAGNSLTSARAQYELAKITRSNGKPGQAYREFQVLMYGYGGKLAKPEVQRYQIQAALQAADCAAERARDAFRSDQEKHFRQAEKCLAFVIESRAGSKDAELATRRMANLVDKFDFEPLRR